MLRNLTGAIRAKMVKVQLFAVAIMGLLLVGPLAAHATVTPPTVPVIDYPSAGDLVLASVSSTVNTLFPYLAVLVALWAGIKIFKRMVKAGAAG
jgi:hypothetical protein